MKPELDRPRVGWLIDGTPDTPDRSVMLTVEDGEPTITVPCNSRTGDDGYWSWFQGESHVPDALWFHDMDGTVALAGCRFGRWRNRGIVAEMGEGIIRARLAVLGGESELDYSFLNGVVTRPQDLTAWMTDQEALPTVERGSLAALSVSIPDRQPVEVGGAPHLTLIFASDALSSSPDGEETVTLHRWVQAQTWSDELTS